MTLKLEGHKEDYYICAPNKESQETWVSAFKPVSKAGRLPSQSLCLDPNFANCTNLKHHLNMHNYHAIKTTTVASCVSHFPFVLEIFHIPYFL